MTYLEFLFYQEMNEMPTHKAIHIVKSLKNETQESKLVKKGAFYVPLIQSLISISRVDIISKEQAEQKVFV